jgi:hypothetical protein
MKRTPGLFLVCLAVLPLCMLTACSEPESHVQNIKLTNDLGSDATLQLCKDDLHCGSTSDLWPAKAIKEKDILTIAVSNEQTTVFKVTSVIDGQTVARCLRVRLDKPLKTSPVLPLSSATGC